jgi:hypothetical protein
MDERKANPEIVALVREEYAHFVKGNCLSFGRAIMSIDMVAELAEQRWKREPHYSMVQHIYEAVEYLRS